MQENQNIDNVEKKLINLLKNHKGVDNTSLFKILSQTLNKIINEPNKYTKDLSCFELLTNFIKRNNYTYKQRQTDKQVNNIPEIYGENYQWINQLQKLFKEFLDCRNSTNFTKLLFPDFYNENQMLQMAGVSFSEEEALNISMSLRQLAHQTNASSMRFWGKILTSGKDYYVAEGITPNQNADTLPKNAEPKGFGANTYSFWVTHNVLDEWFELPLVTPEQIVQARKIKYIFTGDLNASVKTYPIFEGKEKHLLKAQIVRISCANVLAPKGLYQVNEEDPNKIEFTEDPFKLPEYTELKELGAWCHLHPFLNTQGRQTYYIDPSLNEEQKAAAEEEAQKDENVSERLKDIAEEKTPFLSEAENEEAQLNWVVREYGDPQQFSTEDATLQYSVIVIRSKTWMGHYTICNNKRWANIYIGYGLKTNQMPFVPTQPDDMLAEVDDTEEQPEPNHKEPPPKEEVPEDGEPQE